MIILEKAEKIIIISTIFFIPIVVLDFFTDPFFISKNLILVIGILLSLFLFILKTLIKKEFTFTSSNFDFPLTLVLFGYLLSAFFITPNKVEAFFYPGNASVIIGLYLFYFLVNQAKISGKEIKLTLFFSSLIFSLISIFASIGVFENIPQLPEYMKITTFNPSGGLFPAVIFLTSVIPLIISLVAREKYIHNKIFLSVASVFIAFGVFTSFYNVFTNKNIQLSLMDFKSSWEIAIESLKQNPLLGIGPGNYLTAFNRFKPLFYNSTDLWSTKYIFSRSHFLNVLTETGLIGFAGLAILIITFLKNIKKRLVKNFDIVLSLILSIIFLIIFPGSIITLLLFFTFLSLISEKNQHKINLDFINYPNQEKSFFASRIPSLLISLPIVSLIIIISFFGIKTIRAECKYKKSVDYFSQNDIQKTYDSAREAVKINPYSDKYHLSFSKISFAIANSMARNKNLTDKDKEILFQLIQQSINEAKAAVTLNRFRSENWFNLARIYESIMPFSQGADQFAIESYSQAVILDPINPLTRISLGGILYSLGRYDEAIKAFELAVIAKPDHANSHFNLAVSYREKGEIEKAIEQMEIVLSLVEKDSNDYQLAQKEFEQTKELLNSKKDIEKTKATDNLTIPQEPEESLITPPIKLPEEAMPPEFSE